MITTPSYYSHRTVVGDVTKAFCEQVTRDFSLFLGGLEATWEEFVGDRRVSMTFSLGDVTVQRWVDADNVRDIGAILWEAFDELMAKLRASWAPARCSP